MNLMQQAFLLIEHAMKKIENFILTKYKSSNDYDGTQLN